MSDATIHVPAAPGPRAVDSAQIPAGRTCEPPIEFRALLERLREQAAALEKATERTLSAGELSGAVADAGASLQDALSIAEGLLEAYRSSRMGADAGSAAGASSVRGIEPRAPLA